jgi:hypothetical protein
MFQKDQSTLRSSITFSMMKSRKEKVVLQYISPQMSKISKHFGKASVQDERVCILKLELVGTTYSLKKEEMTSKLGGSTDVLLIHGQSFFKFEKWSRMSSSFLVRKLV